MHSTPVGAIIINVLPVLAVKNDYVLLPQLSLSVEEDSFIRRFSYKDSV